jgi:hypothetical protein
VVRSIWLSGEVKGSTINLNYEWLVITSNHTIADMFGPDGKEDGQSAAAKRTLVAALERRFTHYKAHSRPSMDAISRKVLNHLGTSNYPRREQKELRKFPWEEAKRNAIPSLTRINSNPVDYSQRSIEIEAEAGNKRVKTD